MKSAVGGSGSASSSSTAARSSVRVAKSGADQAARRARCAARSSACVYPASRSSAVEIDRRSPRKAMRRCPCASRCSTASTAPPTLSDDDAVCIEMPGRPVDEHERRPGAPLLVEVRVVVARRHDDDPVDAPVAKRADQLALAERVLVAAAGEHEHVAGARRVLDRSMERRRERVRRRLRARARSSGSCRRAGGASTRSRRGGS